LHVSSFSRIGFDIILFFLKRRPPILRLPQALLPARLEEWTMHAYPPAGAAETATHAARGAGPLRAYPENSPKAMARVLAVTLLADGLLESRELDNLARASAYARLGMTQKEFMQVLYEFCQDLLQRAPRSADGYFDLTPALTEQMLGEVTDTARRRTLARLMIEVIRADGRVARGESLMFWEALDAWDMTLPDAAAAPRAADDPSEGRPDFWRRRRMAAGAGARAA
jgi:uncharacterized tellurite resistance protein B-like protein